MNRHFPDKLTPPRRATYSLRILLFLMGLGFWIAAVATAKSEPVEFSAEDAARIIAQERLLAQNATRPSADPTAGLAAPAPSTATGSTVPGSALPPMQINIPSQTGATPPPPSPTPGKPAAAPAPEPYTPKYPEAAEAAKQMQDIRDIRGPVPVPVPLPWDLILAAAVASMALMIAALRGLFGRSHIEVKLPHERALEELHAARTLMEPGQAKAFSYQVSETVRRYIEDRFNARAAHKTTEEFLRELAARPNSSLTGYTEELQAFLTNTDYIKFADAQAGAEDLETLHTSAVHFVTETAPQVDTIEKERADALLRDIQRGALRRTGVLTVTAWWISFLVGAAMVAFALIVLAFPASMPHSANAIRLIFTPLGAYIIGGFGVLELLALAWRPPLGGARAGRNTPVMAATRSAAPETAEETDSDTAIAEADEPVAPDAEEDTVDVPAAPQLKQPASQPQPEEDPDAKYRPKG